jgi:uncharacterized protein (TIGR03085 family)
MTTNFAQAERAALCELFLELGPDAPTLCEGWTTRDLAAHLVVRERRPDAAAGILLPAASRYGESVRLKTADQPWEQLVDLVRSGPPALSPTRLGPVDRLINTNEFFIHHEDVRRAQPGWAPRPPDDGLDGALWTALGRFAKVGLRRAPTGVVIDVGDGRRVTAKDAKPSVEVCGPVPEVALFTSGRQDHARVELRGPSSAVATLRGAQLGL